MSKLKPEQELCKAIWDGDSLESISQIISQIESLNYLDEYGKSPLYLAVGKGNHEVIKLLAQNGASADFYNRNSNDTPRTLATNSNIDANIFNSGDTSNESILQFQPIGSVTLNIFDMFGGQEAFLQRVAQGDSLITHVNLNGEHAPTDESTEGL